MRRTAFTLIEMVAVVTLLGLMAGATVWLLTKDVQGASRAQAIERISREDRLARLTAQRLGRSCVLRFDLDKQQVQRSLGGAEKGAAGSRSVRLSKPYGIDRLAVLGSIPVDGGGTGAAAGARKDSGMMEIAYSTSGRSASYAVRLVYHGAERANDSETRRRSAGGWVVFSGLTGQMTWVQDEEAFDNLCVALAAGRTDAD